MVRGDAAHIAVGGGVVENGLVDGGGMNKPCMLCGQEQPIRCVKAPLVRRAQPCPMVVNEETIGASSIAISK